jgi:hypothetical protein
MSLTDQDFQDIRLSRPVSVTDLWDIDDRIDRLEGIAERLERAVVAFGELYKNERVKNWELILREMLNDRRGQKNEYRTFGAKPKATDIK